MEKIMEKEEDFKEYDRLYNIRTAFLEIHYIMHSSEYGTYENKIKEIDNVISVLKRRKDI
jgi:hypothetical protein